MLAKYSHPCCLCGDDVQGMPITFVQERREYAHTTCAEMEHYFLPVGAMDPRTAASATPRETPASGEVTELDHRASWRVARCHPERLQAISNCMSGACQREGPRELRCSECNRGLHRQCGLISRGAASVGVFRCMDCRLAATLQPSHSPEQRQVSKAICASRMMGQLVGKAKGTYGGYSTFTSRAQRFMDASAQQHPLTSADTFSNFLEWQCREGTLQMRKPYM